MQTPTLVRVIQRTLSDEATLRLREAIRQGVLGPGTRLVERDLAEQLGMSRVPVREALQRLVEEGLATKTAHRGTFVYVPSTKELEEISSLRVVLERFIVARAIERWKLEHEERLQEALDDMYRAAAGRDFQQVYEADFRFHAIIWEIADHSILLEVVSGLRSRLSRFLYEATSALPASQFAQHLATHDALLDVLKSGDLEAGQETITRHILDARDRIMAHHKEIFAGDGLAKE